MKHKVFFSWQSDLPNKTNRGLIGDALERAIRKINTEYAQFSLESEARPDSPQVAVDQATAGLAGSPDIAYSIFDKIKNSTIFVADISIINGHFREQASDEVRFRPTPNPNVLVELGYAANHLGWSSVICVFNTAYSQEDFRSDLPFDLSVRRVLPYRLNPENEPAAVRNSLVSAFEEAIKAILQEHDRVQQVRLTYLRSLLAELDFNQTALSASSESTVYWNGMLRSSQFERLLENGLLTTLPDSLREAIHSAQFHCDSVNGWIATLRSNGRQTNSWTTITVDLNNARVSAREAISKAQEKLAAFIESLESA